MGKSALHYTLLTVRRVNSDAAFGQSEFAKLLRSLSLETAPQMAKKGSCHVPELNPRGLKRRQPVLFTHVNSIRAYDYKKFLTVNRFEGKDVRTTIRTGTARAHARGPRFHQVMESRAARQYDLSDLRTVNRTQGVGRSSRTAPSCTSLLNDILTRSCLCEFRETVGALSKLIRFGWLPLLPNCITSLPQVNGEVAGQCSKSP